MVLLRSSDVCAVAARKLDSACSAMVVAVIAAFLPMLVQLLALSLMFSSHIIPIPSRCYPVWLSLDLTVDSVSAGMYLQGFSKAEMRKESVHFPSNRSLTGRQLGQETDRFLNDRRSFGQQRCAFREH